MARARPQTASDGWSRLVGWLKIVLPLIALAILSTLFLVSRNINPDDAIPYAEVDVEDRLREPRMTAPTYAGTTADGAAIVITADSARPGQGKDTSASAIAVRGSLTTPDGAVTDIVAATAALMPDGSAMTLGGGVRITTSTGYDITTDSLTAGLTQTQIKSGGPVVANGPGGQVTADAMVIEEQGDGSGTYLLVFNGRVKLVYHPTQ